MLEWLAVMVVFFTSPEQARVGIIKQEQQYKLHGDCEIAIEKLNLPLNTTINPYMSTATSPVWVCIPVVVQRG